jgi:hypothetical protein
MESTRTYRLFLLALVFIMAMITGSGISAEVRLSHIPSDTVQVKNSQRFLFLPKDSAEKISEYLLNNHPLFTDHWVNDVAFVYDHVDFNALPDKIVIPLVKNDERFKLTWYGRLTSTYKKRWGRFHQGLDIDLEKGDSVFAAFDGVVRYAQYNNAGFGKCVIVRHLNGLETVYGHLSKITVKPNEYVSAGQTVGLGGSTGRSYGTHLHFETRYKDFSFDPSLFIDFENQTLRSDQLILSKKDFVAHQYRYTTHPYLLDASPAFNVDDLEHCEDDTTAVYATPEESNIVYQRTYTRTSVRTSRHHGSSKGKHGKTKKSTRNKKEKISKRGKSKHSSTKVTKKKTSKVQSKKSSKKVTKKKSSKIQSKKSPQSSKGKTGKSSKKKSKGSSDKIRKKGKKKK